MPKPTIKQLVFDLIRRSRGQIGFDAITQEVVRNFPDSRWSVTHWNYYRSGISSPNGRYYTEFDDEVRANLSKRRRADPSVKVKEGPAQAATSSLGATSGSASTGPRGRRARNSEVKQIGDRLLRYVRLRLDQECRDEDFRFAVNRWIFARLQQDEIRVKRPIKQALWESGMKSCKDCGKDFGGPKGLELHRLDPLQRYTLENSVLLCRPCHEIADLESGR